MTEYFCSCCGCTIESEADPQGNVTCRHCGEVLPVSSLQKLLSAGTRVAGYEIIRHIASGGTGSVYLAEQISMERQVALKILNADQVSSGNAERFLNEARTTAKFENPHVVSVIDTGISDGYYYLAMQYVDGESLEDILQRGRVFSEEETLIIGITVADALRTIWNKYKMFHKDIKPGNIMLTRENEAMILDMGTAQERGKSLLAD
ncbi:MAG: serine/threonine protein kinase, partial [Lentisphaeria bacterium]|nr:serine/threonine protein kinase [Lentisphaeria bacterium]